MSSTSVKQPHSLTIGVLSDTHGQLLPVVVERLKGVAHIVHAGDVGSPEVLTALRALAPVTVVRGNCDLGGWAEVLPLVAEVQIGSARVLVAHMAHRLKELLARAAREVRAPDSAVREARGPDSVLVAISGHTHQAAVEWREGVLHLNPGSAGPLRYGKPRTMAKLTIYDGSRVEPELVRLS